ncbi:MAG TPA: hypothetical protein VIE67_02845 [Rudaea sp.]|uniref:hypothetical protein n=1 Tax=Rudaea sp. TaxID=2136325 RepID=UPI002F93BF70
MVNKNLLALVLLSSGVFLPWSVSAQNEPTGAGTGGVESSDAVQHDVSPPLGDMAAAPGARVDSGHSKRDKPLHLIPRGLTAHQKDPVVQTSTSSFVATTSGLNFAGVGNGAYGFVPNSAPPDTNGAVGATQYVQWVNESFAVFDKTTGALVHGPIAGNTLWSGFGGGCETNNDGDPIVQYDKAANRWVMTQFSVTTTPYLQCVAVSTTSDAMGPYNRYAFSQPNFNDYPKLGVWPDGYYVSFNMFSGNNFAGGRACAFDRTAMLAGNPATQICFQLSSSFGGLLPSDLDGSTPPPAGSPNYYVAFGNDSASLDIWKFHADFATPSNSTFVHSNIPAPAFAAACGGGGTCIPQSGTRQQLDSLADRLMHRLAYRNFGDHESLVVNHSVTAGSSVGVRWYEIRNPGGSPAVFQAGTYAPDANYRWMGSIAMDKVGNIALGYSVSSSSMHPAIRYTGRAPGDALGTLQAENIIVNGAGSQTTGLTRWGDYSAMTIDPTDDCTFFYTNEYLNANGTFNWSTQIASFKFPSCTGSPPVLTTITVSPASASVQTGGTKQFSATGYDQFGQPVSPQPTFTWSVSGGGSISASGLFTAGSTAGGPFTVTAASGSVSGTASVTVTASPVLTTITVTPASASVQTGGTKQFSATGYDQFSQPVSPQPTFIWSVSGGGSISASGLFTAGSTAGGPFTVTATSGSVSGTANVTVTSVPPDFSLSAGPSSQSVKRGNTATYTVTITPANGFNGSVTLSLTGQPSGSTVTFTPNPATSTSTLTVKTLSTTSRRTYTLTIKGVSGSLSHTTTTSLTVTK